jgi:hypothetical protein
MASSDTARRIFADLADPQTINRAADDMWKSALADVGRPLAPGGISGGPGGESP